MKTIFKITVVALVFMLSSACAEADSAGADKQAARDALIAFADAINAGDIEKAGAIYDRDAGFHWIDRGTVQYESGEAAAQSLNALMAEGANATMTFEDILLTDLTPGAVLVSAKYQYDIRYTDDRQGFAFGGWMTLAMVKRDDGWKIAGGQAGPAAE
ncbi:nuclear transport factor 2 family protein [Hyphococcus flavus]|uniref:Nuclear transport factor 2 family protein n=1 Tax=Hyphococcus flavus TaxID=1866326 RepID=A0AAE9ZCZ7_9PROT|nr:nuclear transport factor 2 family protein [Hyphococcus flavus]WDI32251.1 nuclear transport factor 2 family protein [Hyphococcus flavus]